jgi:hypothetical protein
MSWDLPLASPDAGKAGGKPAAASRLRSRLTWMASLVLSISVASLLEPSPSASRSAQLQLVFEEQPVNLSNSPDTFSDAPQVIVTRNGEVHVVWTEDAPSAFLGTNILGRNRVADLWSAPAVVAYSAQDPALVSWDGDSVAAAYALGREGDDLSVAFKILLARFDPAARTWNRQRTLIPTSQGGIQPSMDYADGRFWLTWVDTSAGVRRPQFAGLRNDPTPDPIANTLSGIEDNVQSPQVLTASDGPDQTDVHFAWMNEVNTDSDISHVWMSAAAPTPSVNRDLDNYYLYGQPRRPDLASTSRSGVCLAWQEAVSFEGVLRQDIIRMCSPWSEARNETNSSEISGEPSLALDAEYGALLLWQERKSSQSDEEIRFLQSLPAITSTVYTGTVSMPDIAYNADSGDVHAVWVDQAIGTSGSDVFYARWKANAPSPTPSHTATVTPTPSRTPKPTQPTSTITPPPEKTPTPGSPTITPTPSRTPTAPPPTATPASRLFVPRLDQI